MPLVADVIHDAAVPVFFSKSEVLLNKKFGRVHGVGASYLHATPLQRRNLLRFLSKLALSFGKITNLSCQSVAEFIGEHVKRVNALKVPFGLDDSCRQFNHFKPQLQ